MTKRNEERERERERETRGFIECSRKEQSVDITYNAMWL